MGRPHFYSFPGRRLRSVVGVLPKAGFDDLPCTGTGVELSRVTKTSGLVTLLFKESEIRWLKQCRWCPSIMFPNFPFTYVSLVVR